VKAVPRRGVLWATETLGWRSVTAWLRAAYEFSGALATASDVSSKQPSRLRMKGKFCELLTPRMFQRPACSNAVAGRHRFNDRQREIREFLRGTGGGCRADKSATIVTVGQIAAVYVSGIHGTNASTPIVSAARN
jgi:hypothetical protein